jgi:hypothetical protein
MVLPQGGMRRPRDQVARQQTAPWRRSDQNSRRMFGRRMGQSIRPEIILQGCNTVQRGEKRMDNSCRDAGEAHGSTGRHVDALVATDRRRNLRGTARHVGCCPVGHVRCGHIARHRLRRNVRGWLSHDRPGDRSQRKAGDHRDHQQPAYREIALHGLGFTPSCGKSKAPHVS